MKTKTRLIRNSFCGLILGLSSMMLVGQNNGLEYHSFSLTPFEVFGNEDFAGLAATADLTFSSNGHLLSVNASTGAEIAIFGRARSYTQLNLLYGREIEVENWFFIDVHAGAGLFLYDKGETTIGKPAFPTVVKFRFKTGPRFSFGLKYQGNFNSIKNVYSAGLVLQWNSI